MSNSSQPPAQRHSEKPKVLVVDDDRLGTEVRAELLRLNGFDVDIALSGTEALAKAASQEFDIFAVDYDMPGMNGVELARELRLRGYSAPVVMLSGRLEPPAEPGTELLTCFVSKGQGPVTLLEVLNSLTRCVEKPFIPSGRRIASDFSILH
jgi:CheY-like chemotaxis protein